MANEGRKPRTRPSSSKGSAGPKRSGSKPGHKPGNKSFGNKKRPYGKFSKSKTASVPVEGSSSEGVRLNKFIAHSGVCSRREADKLIADGLITVNGKVIVELGAKVLPGDEVRYAGDLLRNEQLVYLLLNKPKDYITTTDDPRKRKTVSQLIAGACKERLYPVGRLDKMTTGLLLFTNDGEMARKLTNPKKKMLRVYHAVTDKKVSRADLEKLVAGMNTPDGFGQVEKAEFATGHTDKKNIGIQISTGKDRILRTMFEELGYKLVKLDRVAYAGISKKNLSRGRFRFLTEKEVGMLKMQGF